MASRNLRSLDLSAAERGELTLLAAWLRKAQALARGARIVLAAPWARWGRSIALPALRGHTPN
jgi:predicted nucleotidyltransferase